MLQRKMLAWGTHQRYLVLLQAGGGRERLWSCCLGCKVLCRNGKTAESAAFSNPLGLMTCEEDANFFFQAYNTHFPKPLSLDHSAAEQGTALPCGLRKPQLLCPSGWHHLQCREPAACTHPRCLFNGLCSHQAVTFPLFLPDITNC